MANTKQPSMIYKVTFIFTALVLVTTILYLLPPLTKPFTCVERSPVKEILELRYRDAIILLGNGQKIDVNQATLKPGDLVCSKWERR